MPLEFVKADDDKGDPHEGAIAAYNEIENSHFSDMQKNTLNAVVRAVTGFVPAGYKVDAGGNVLVGQGEDGAKGVTDKKTKQAAKDKAATDKAASEKANSQSNTNSQGNTPSTGA